jgi:hypothetical protein
MAFSGRPKLRGVGVDEMGKRISAVVAGCYIAEDAFHEYAGSVNQTYWRGLVVLRNVDGAGGFDPEFVSIGQLRKRYG